MRVAGLSPRKARKLGIGIEGLGHITSPASMAILYASSDVFVNPTYAESYGMTKIEALTIPQLRPKTSPASPIPPPLSAQATPPHSPAKPYVWPKRHTATAAGARLAGNLPNRWYTHPPKPLKHICASSLANSLKMRKFAGVIILTKFHTAL